MVRKNIQRAGKKRDLYRVDGGNLLKVLNKIDPDMYNDDLHLISFDELLQLIKKYITEYDSNGKKEKLNYNKIKKIYNDLGDHEINNINGRGILPGLIGHIVKGYDKEKYNM